MMNLQDFDHHAHKRHVLIVEDEAINQEMLGYIVSQDYHVHYANNGREALDMLRAGDVRYAAVLLDLMMPVMNGYETLEAMRADDRLRQIPVIVLTSDSSAEVETLRVGASDFIKKPYNNPEVILARVRHMVELAEDRNIIETVEEDKLTGLYTKELFFKYATDMDFSDHMDAIVVDLDHFHLFNEMHGREAGDAVLCLLADAIKDDLKDRSGIACRCEADTFYIYCEHRDDHDGLLSRLSERVAAEGQGVVHVRMGVCTRSDMVQDIIGRFDRARAACNRVRGNYLNGLAFYDDRLYESDIRDQRLISDMEDAIAERQFCVYYQPKYNVQNGRPSLVSAEALVRWRHPEFGLVSPGVFVPLFERNGMIREMDAFVWREAGAQIRAWRERFGFTLPVSVNVSRIDLHDTALKDKLDAVCEENELKRGELLLEITESAYTEDTEQALRVIRALRASGYAIEMDDFGTGYSSLNMLLDLPIDTMKVDSRFIQSIRSGGDENWLIGVLIDIAHHLDANTVFEGVEEEEQVKIIREAGGDVIQGYFFSKPLPPEEFERLIEKELREREHDD